MECLIVDDSTTVRKIIRRILEDLKFSCEEAEDGTKAVEACKKKMPQLIFLDWNMPNMNGLEFLKALRSMEKGSDPKVIFCTTENSMDFIQNGMSAGADEYIMKPFDKTMIQSKLVHIGVLKESV
jgi:two-component system, chemotaxis family, chemotaxis protein CheY